MLCLRGSNFGFAVFGEQIIEGVQAAGGGNSVTSVPQQPDIIPLKEVEKHAILVAMRRLGV